MECIGNKQIFPVDGVDNTLNINIRGRDFPIMILFVAIYCRSICEAYFTFNIRQREVLPV